jgi:hypothetical protein
MYFSGGWAMPVTEGISSGHRTPDITISQLKTHETKSTLFQISHGIAKIEV